ncbi:MAG: DNA recombination protein RmuC [Clostridia bacterium]|nr:DNA recombination protein RmuC [Clostridia bacterium]
MEIVFLLLLLAVVILIFVCIFLTVKQKDIISSSVKNDLSSYVADIKNDILGSVKLLSDNNLGAMEQLSKMLHINQNQASEIQARQLSVMEQNISLNLDKSADTTVSLIDRFQESISAQFIQMNQSLAKQHDQFSKQTAFQISQMETRLQGLEKNTEEKLNAMRTSISDNMVLIRNENAQKLDEIRGTVDEKLQSTLEKRIAESFKTVSERLEQVYKGLGEMKNLANDVGGLKKVLSGVKTRGILGEVQLGAILEDILTKDQYDTNVVTIPGRNERVEFAVKLPGENGSIYLPIDSKFPADRYSQLISAKELGDKSAIESAYKLLETTIKNEAKNIKSKYIEVPYTTNFGIMFLPFEGLYAEVVNRGLVEVLQRDFHINIAGPSTMAALLNSLQMGFRTLAIQKRSSEVWILLDSVKSEFEKFDSVLEKMQTHLNQTSKDLDNLMGTRTRAIKRQLSNVQKLDTLSITDNIN